MFSLRVWREQESYDFDLLSDFWPHGAVANEYGVFDAERGMAVRGSFLIDAAGIVRWSVVNPPGEPRDLEGYMEALARL
jgi:alkyl hydroperoxide reductase subunit AhpC